MSAAFFVLMQNENTADYAEKTKTELLSVHLFLYYLGTGVSLRVQGHGIQGQAAAEYGRIEFFGKRLYAFQAKGLQTYGVNTCILREYNYLFHKN